MLMIALVATAMFSACELGNPSISGKTCEIQCLWTGGPNDFSPVVQFKSDGTVLHRDDTTSGISGTWTETDGNVFWSLSNPPKNTSFRGSFDNKAINGNISDDLGATGIFQGTVK
jgi:hypothetical protein